MHNPFHKKSDAEKKPDEGFKPPVPRAQLPKDAPPPKPTIWSQCHAYLKSAIEESLHCAKGRYGGVGSDGRGTIHANPYWNTVVTKNWIALNPMPLDEDKGFDRNALAAEYIEVFVKLGPNRIEWFPGDTEDERHSYLVQAKDLVHFLEAMQKAIDEMTPDSELGQMVHQHAIEMAGLKEKGQYNPRTDRYEQ